jgi:hypothetical protein
VRSGDRRPNARLRAYRYIQRCGDSIGFARASCFLYIFYSCHSIAWAVCGMWQTYTCMFSTSQLSIPSAHCSLDIGLLAQPTFRIRGVRWTYMQCIIHVWSPIAVTMHKPVWLTLFACNRWVMRFGSYETINRSTDVVRIVPPASKERTSLKSRMQLEGWLCGAQHFDAAVTIWFNTTHHMSDNLYAMPLWISIRAS